MSAPVYRVGLAGAGYVSQFHIRALLRLPNVRLVGVCDAIPSRAQDVATRFKLPKAFDSLKAMGAEGLDVVHVLTPPAFHAEVTLEALAMGCHVLVEKPVSTRVEDCDRIAEAARVAGKTVGVNHSYLRNPTVVRALSAVGNGLLGQVVAVDYFRSSEYPPYVGGPLPPQYGDGGYPFRDLGVHGLYLLEAFLGDIRDADGQFASSGREPLLLYDEWRAQVRCARGSGQIQLSWNVHPLQHVLQVQGTHGVLRADLFTHILTIKRNTRLPKAVERATNALGESRQIATQVFGNAVRFVAGKLFPYQELTTMVADFYDCLAAGKPAPVTPLEAKPSLQWTESIAQKADVAKTELQRSFSKPATAPILVTGSSGFIGSHLLKLLLAQNEPVRIILRRDPPAEIAGHPLLEVVRGDLADPEAAGRAMAGCRLIYHLAGPVGTGDPSELRRGMVAATRNVVEYALREPEAKLVYMSSLSCLHNAAAAGKNVQITEDWPLEPHAERRGAYTQTKLEAEMIVTNAVKNRGLRAVILRPGRVIGAGTSKLLPEVARRAGGRLVVLGNGELPLPLVSVDDVAEGVLLAGRGDCFDGSVFHLVSPERLTQNDYLAEYLRVTGEKLSVIRMPMPIVYLLARGVEILAGILKRPAPLSVYRIQSSMTPLNFDCSAAEKKLGWKAKVTLKQAVATTLTAP